MLSGIAGALSPPKFENFCFRFFEFGLFDTRTTLGPPFENKKSKRNLKKHKTREENVKNA